MANDATRLGMENGWIPKAKKEYIVVERRDEIFDLEISTISSLPALIEAVQKKFPSAPKLKKLYRLREGTPIVVTDVSDLQEEYLYHVLAGSEEPPKKQTTNFCLEVFFVKLKTEQDMSDAQIEYAKESFVAQGLTANQVMATGELALTDADLKEIGITQGGLRKAILSVIRSNQ
jgi:hypothetical protein